MKKIFIILLSLTTLHSCNFLDTDVYGSMEQDELYRDEKSCMAGLLGVYDALQAEGAYGLNLWGNLDAGTDILVYNRSYGANDPKVYLYNYNNTDTDLEKTWKALYEGINRANDYIELIGKRTNEECGSGKNKRTFIAEAKALRALFYMNLVAFWGEVPLRLEATRDLDTQQLKRASQEEIYEAIINDLTDAEESCRPADELDTPGRVSKTTVQALLARAYMWEAGYPVYADTWDEALYWARKVKESGLHNLYQEEDGMNGYCALFKNMCSNLYDLQYRESMFEVEFYGNGVSDKSNETGRLGLYLGVSQGSVTDPDVPFAYAWYDATKILFRLYDDDDARKWWNIADYKYETGENGKVKEIPVDKTKQVGGNPGKWRAKYDPVRPWSKNASSINFPVMRYSDVLLMIAECSNEVNEGPTQEAIDAINAVRERVGATRVEMGDFAGAGEFRMFVRDERTRELCFEVPRRMELRRHGEDYFFQRVSMLADTQNLVGTDFVGYTSDNIRSLPAQNMVYKHIYFPIPQVELNTNPTCGQNENW